NVQKLVARPLLCACQACRRLVPTGIPGACLSALSSCIWTALPSSVPVLTFPPFPPGETTKDEFETLLGWLITSSGPLRSVALFLHRKRPGSSARNQKGRASRNGNGDAEDRRAESGSTC